MARSRAEYELLGRQRENSFIVGDEILGADEIGALVQRKPVNLREREVLRQIAELAREGVQAANLAVRPDPDVLEQKRLELRTRFAQIEQYAKAALGQPPTPPSTARTPTYRATAYQRPGVLAALGRFFAPRR